MPALAWQAGHAQERGEGEGQDGPGDEACAAGRYDIEAELGPAHSAELHAEREQHDGDHGAGEEADGSLYEQRQG